MNHRTALLYIAAICLLSSWSPVQIFADETPDVQYECPDDNAAFVKICSGGDGGAGLFDESLDDDAVGDDNIVDDMVADENLITDENAANDSLPSTSHDDTIFDESHLVNEVLHESSDQQQQSSRAQHTSSQTCSTKFNDSSNENIIDELGDNANAMQQLQHTFVKLTHRYYDPLPEKARCAVGTICGFASSRIAMGVANRAIRLTGAVWVASEVLHTSGFCDETKCVPEEMRPWIGIIRRGLIKQCNNVRTIARKIYNQDRIQEIAKRDGMFAGGFASGAFVGFVV